MTSHVQPAAKPVPALRFTPTSVIGAVVIDPILREDDRGHFSRAWCLNEFAEHGINFVPLNANRAFNVRKGTLRGMHFQTRPALEAKLIRCTRGRVFDVVVDLRRESETYLRWFGTELTVDNGRMLYIPERCGHGYQTLEDSTDMFYLTSQFYAPSAAAGVRYDDPAFKIEWPMEPTAMSDLDRNWPLITAGTFSL